MIVVGVGVADGGGGGSTVGVGDTGAAVRVDVGVSKGGDCGVLVGGETVGAIVDVTLGSGTGVLGAPIMEAGVCTTGTVGVLVGVGVAMGTPGRQRIDSSPTKPTRTRKMRNLCRFTMPLRLEPAHCTQETGSQQTMIEPESCLGRAIISQVPRPNGERRAARRKTMSGADVPLLTSLSISLRTICRPLSQCRISTPEDYDAWP